MRHDEKEFQRQQDNDDIEALTEHERRVWQRYYKLEQSGVNVDVSLDVFGRATTLLITNEDGEIREEAIE